MIRVGVLGAGAWGLNHVRVISSEPRCALVAVADPDPRIETQLPARVRYHGDPDELLADPTLDAVVIATPAPTHAALARAVLSAGKHVLIEKPLALSCADAIAVEEVARRCRRVALVGHLMIYHPAVVRLREILLSGELGKLHYLHTTRVNLGRLRSDENALWSFGPHDLSMIDFLIGQEPQTVAARGQCVLQPGVEDVVFLTLRYPSGEMAHVHLSWLSPRKERRLTLVCSQKMVEFDDVATEKLRIYDKGYDRPPGFTEYSEYLTIRDGDVFIPQIAMHEPLRLQLQHFADCIEHNATPRADLESAIRVTRVLEAAAKSLACDGSPFSLA